ncbi:tumor necrosis factor receptor superfamily member 8 isoform X1 [Pogona vitticeps]
MRLLGRLALLGFLLLPRIAAAPSQGSAASRHDCAGGPLYYDEAARTCCYRCPEGYRAKTACPRDVSSGCTKVPCQSESFLNSNYVTPHCEACVSCNPERHLVETQPCTPTSNRVCQCQAGWYCQTTPGKTCHRCNPHSSCKPGFGVRTRGTAERDTVCQKCPPGTFSDEESNTQPCKNHTDCAQLNKLTQTAGNATHDRRCTDQAADRQLNLAVPVDTVATLLKFRPATIPGTKEPSAPLGNSSVGMVFSITTGRPQAGFDPSHIPRHATLARAERTSRRDGRSLALLGASLLVVSFALLAVFLFLWRRRACARWIVPHKVKITHQAKVCGVSMAPILQVPPALSRSIKEYLALRRKPCLSLYLQPPHPNKGPRERHLWRRWKEKRIDTLLSADPEPEGGDPVSAEALPETPSDSPLLEMEGPSALEPDGAELVQVDGGRWTEPPPQSHTSNRIEKIYIMRANTVIVGSVSEVPPGKTCGSGDEEDENAGVQEDGGQEQELAMHYPEQETEFCPGSDVTTPVEEEWEFQYSGGKTLAI